MTARRPITATEALAHFASEIRIDSIPPAVRDNAVLRVLDTIGCALAARDADFAPSILGLAASPGG